MCVVPTNIEKNLYLFKLSKISENYIENEVKGKKRMEVFWEKLEAIV